MNADDLEKLSVELCRLWPRKFTDDELADWGTRFSRYMIGDVLRALDSHKNGKPFAPKVNEILAVVKGKERREESDDPCDREGSWADVRRRQNPQWVNCTDAEVALRYWRSLWFRRKSQSPGLDGFRVHVTNGCLMALMAGGLKQAVAERCLPFVFEEDLGIARLMLADVRQMNEQGEPVDAFA